jgi:HSP20 family protein
MLPIIRKHQLFPACAEVPFGGDFFADFFDNKTGISVPAVNVVESKDRFFIEVAAPGLNKDDFRINLEKNILTISSEKEVKNENNDKRFMRREFSYSNFRRTFSLPQTIDSEGISATYSNGILFVEIPKKDDYRDKPSKEIKIS